ncbi:4-hydroxyphenylpyruvate dioxygenase [Batrachochytrium salamandrivorans]|nr:4-hydroxyphenylpyruvate dioxygenase [Batrachochytrium salamandrivorans]
MENKRAKFEIGKGFLGFDHVHWYVGNAKLVADYYVSHFGFDKIAFRGLETGCRSTATHVVKRNSVVFAFSSPYSSDSLGADFGDNLTEHVVKHGDGVKDVAFRVENCRDVFDEAVRRGAKPVRSPVELKDDHGTVCLATVETYGDTLHTFVERNQSQYSFLPGFKSSFHHTVAGLPVPQLKFIDHCVGNQPEGEMDQVCDWYKDKLDFHRFWTVDDTQIHTEYSSLRSTVMADSNLTVKMPINEPAQGKRVSQIQEFVNYYGGPGVQHIALNTDDCVETVSRLKQRGVEFLQIPHKYYANLQHRLKLVGLEIHQDFVKLEELGILVDFDSTGYLLQIFTKPLQDRPTVFLEIIQRCGNEGFGAGNFKALFESIERDQEARGNL